MSRRLSPFPALEGAQEEASDPEVHAALSASAGTGKTQVLTARVLRLLLRGVRPEAILCLTFTKAGAAEMANRIGARLAAWVRMDDTSLGMELFALGEERDKPALRRARQLFARVLEAPGGLRIQTLHSFAQSLLASFPVEAGITPGFRPVEGRAKDELARETLADLIADAERNGDRQLLDDVRTLSLRLGELGAERYLMDSAAAAPDLADLGEPAHFERALRELLAVPEGDIDAVLADGCDGHIDCALLERLIDANRAWGTQSGAKICARLGAYLAASREDRPALLVGLSDGLARKEDGALIAPKPKQLAAEPDYEELAQQLVDAVAALCQLQTAASLARVQAAGLRAGARFARAFASAKRSRGLADFDDLIRWTRTLLGQPGMGDWVRFKLDRRTDHVLVDEAQDTNADQWEIVAALIEEFFSGEDDAEDRWRTLFMVGDYKQAIYGFQGTDPREFERFRADIADRAGKLASAAGFEQPVRAFRDLSIDSSFRSSPAVLQVVDQVLAGLGPDAMGLQRAANRHHPARDYAGRVELWPPFTAQSEDDDEEDLAAGDEGWIGQPVRLYADALAGAVANMVREAPVLASTDRPLGPGDILILVRSRGELASLIVARLAARGVPVAGIDRLLLSKPLAVRDLLSAMSFAVQPEDDLNLAGLLVSPLVGWDQDTLFRVAHGRKGSLWSVIQSRREEVGIVEAHAVLGQLLDMADRVPPSRFLETILSGPLDGRKKLLARLGHAARDPIEELVSSALDYERHEGSSLDRFISWFDKGEVEIKRDPSAPAAAVRVMTVHGAKGLEAPVVILADATYDPAKSGGPSSTFSHPLRDGGKSIPLVRPRSDERVPPYGLLMDAIKARELEEHWRLLYVALTRARERLIVAGALGRHALKTDSWHARVEAAMRGLGALTIPGPWGDALGWAGGSKKGRQRLSRHLGDVAPITLPAWVREAAPEEERPPRPLAPSSLGQEEEKRPPPTPALRDAARRGILLHALFERLPEVDADRRREVASAWLRRHGLDNASAADLAEAACTILADARFADLFGPDSLSEAPIAATLPDGRVVTGTVDRLLVDDHRVRVIDFKTGSSVPSDAESVPSHHRSQMDAYVAALRVIFPRRSVEASLLYTHGPKLLALTG